jgi:endo-1,4-beta-D-glucanase Y
MSQQLSPNPAPRRRFWLRPEEWVLVAITIVAQSIAAWWIHHLGMTLSLTDADAHIDFSRLLTHSLTPGISQIGFWPPLLQLVMAPYAANLYLYQTGLAGFFGILPFLVIGVIALYRLVTNLTNSRVFGFTAVLLFIADPYVLYYGSVPMMELLFVANLFTTAYNLVRWLQNHDLRHLIWLGVFVTLTAMSRFEGIALLPLIGIIIFLDLWRRKTQRTQLEATLLLFAMVAMVGLLFILVYSWVFGGTPLAFLSTSSVRDPVTNLTITKYSIVKTLTYLGSASYVQLGRPLVWLGLSSLILAPIIKDKRFERIAALIVLISPILIIATTLFNGTESVLTPNLPPYNFYHNDRYALTWIGLVIVGPLSVLAGLLAYARSRRLVRPLVTFAVSLSLSCLLAFSGYRLYTVAYAQQFPAVARNINGPIDPQRSYQEGVADFLKSHYDFGYVLLTRSNEDPVLHDSQVPLQNFIYEANYRYFDQTLTEPEIFARWVVTNNPADGDAWSAQNDDVEKLIPKSSFQQDYTLVYQNQYRNVYEINQTAVLQEALDRGYNPQMIPSLTSQPSPWDPGTVYSALVATTNRPDLVGNSVALQTALQQTYNKQLKPQIQKGWVLSSDGTDTSENQAYAMQQALLADDPATFATVWKWTQSHIQRPDDLLSYQFTVDANGAVTIQDANSTTSADTDAAAALLEAGSKWKNTTYTTAGTAIVKSIWTNDTEYDAFGNRHVLAGNWGRLTAGFVMDSQALEPADYRIFAGVDKTDNWNLVLSTAYSDLNAISQPSFNGTSRFLPTNWALLDSSTGKFTPYTAEAGYNDFSYGAFRAVWHVAQDYQANKSADAKAYLTQLTSFTDANVSKLCSVYVAGKTCYVDAASLAAPVSTLQALDPAKAQQVIGTYDLPHELLDFPKADYFQQSWYWFTLEDWAARNATTNATA